MSILFNPVFVSVTVLCTLCLCRLHVLISLVLAALIGAAVGGIPLSQAMEILCGGFGTNAGTALSYIFLGAFASGVASTGLADWMSRIFAKNLGGCRGWICLALAGTAALSQNLIPVHIAFIPIMIPPLLTLFDRMKLDRRSAACSLAFGLKAPYICIPFGFGFIFIKIVADNMTASGMPVSVMDVTKCNWLLGLAMFVGLLFAILVTYRKPREYPNSVSRCTGSPECPGSSFFPECTESVGGRIAGDFRAKPCAGLSGHVCGSCCGRCGSGLYPISGTFGFVRASAHDFRRSDPLERAGRPACGRSQAHGDDRNHHAGGRRICGSHESHRFC